MQKYNIINFLKYLILVISLNILVALWELYTSIVFYEW
jgi:hypothetical protein